MTRIVVAFFTIILLSAYTLYAQNYHFQNYSLEEGLPQSQVWKMLQDSRGSIWMGTNGGGLVRFNGNKFEVFRKKDGLPSEQIAYLFEDGHQRLWLETFDRDMVIYDGLEFKMLRFNKKKVFRYSDLFNDAEGNTWFLGKIDGDEAISIYKHTYDSLINVSNQYEEFIGANFSGLYMTKNDLLYITTENGIYELKNEELKRSELNDLNAFDNAFFQPVYEDLKGNLWIMHRKKKSVAFYKYNEGNLRSIEFPVDIDFRNENQFKFTEDADGGFWIMNNRDKELYHWKNDPDELSFETWSNINGFPDIFVRDIMEDDEGNVWLATDGDGLFRMGGNRFLTFSSNPEIANKIIWTIFQDSKENYWFGTSAYGIIKYDGEKFTDLFSLQTEPLGIIFSIIEDDEGNYLIGAGNGLFEYNGKSIYRVDDKYDIPRGWINYILKDGEDYWFALVGTGVIKYSDGKAVQFTQDNSNLFSTFIDHIYKDSRGDLWFAGRNGVARFENGDFVNFTEENGLPDLTMMQLAEDKLGRIWVATYGEGIACIDPTKPEKPICAIIGEKEGMSSGNIYSLISDNDGNLWAGGQLGVDRVSFSEDGKLLEIKNFDKYEGFTGIENNSKANLVDKDGNLWFGTIDGVMVYNPDQERKNLTPPVTSITNVKLSYREIDWTNEENKELSAGISPWYHTPIDLTLPYNKNHISFDFEGLSYRVPEKVRYQWMLEGMDEDWFPVSSKNDAIYSNLPPGDYTFKVKASNNDGVWNETPTEYAFTIKSPFWATWWFRSIVILFLLSVILIIAWLRTKFIRERQEELEHLVDFKTKKLQDQKDEIELKNLELLDLNNDKNHIISLVAHDLRNPLTSALTMAGVLDMEDKNLSDDQKQCVRVIVKGLNRMNDMIVRILDVRRIESQKLDLNLQKIDLQTIIAEVNNNMRSETIRKKIKVHIKAEEIFATLDRDFATQIFENLFSNAIKFSPPERSVKITLIKENGKARAEIRDEGPGLTKDDMKKLFGKFQRLSAKPTGGEHSTGIGLSIVKKYVEAMNGKVWCESEPGKGANFIVEFDRAD